MGLRTYLRLKDGKGSASDRALKEAATKQSSDLMNALISQKGYKDYLEIGVQGGVTFLNVDAQNKDAVDPSFLFDTSQHANDRTRFFSLTSDDFFTRGEQRSYDLIFIDGWHSYEQALRDFCNSLVNLRPGGAIVIDDVFPDDAFSSLATQADAIQFRTEHGLNTGPYARSWAGDVFKVVFFIHDFFPVLDYVTVRDTENPFHKPQTLVWQAPRADFKPVFGNMDAINQTNWFDLRRLDEVFRFASKDEALRRIDLAAQSK